MKRFVEKSYICFFIFLLAFFHWGQDRLDSVPVPQDPGNPVVVAVFSEPPDAENAAYGTGIVVDKDNGLVLTARHGVYSGKVSNYKNEALFKNIIVTDKTYLKRMRGYVVHLSHDNDLAIIKVNHHFPAQAVFESSDDLAINDEVGFKGFPGGQYAVLKGNLSDIKDDYFNLDMSVKPGMSGGPVWAAGSGVVGVVLLQQSVGGSALRSEVIRAYLAEALPRARRIKKRSYSLSLKKLKLSREKASYAREEEPKLYLRVILDGKQVLESEEVEASGSEVSWANKDKNKCRLDLLPGAKIAIQVMESAWGPLKDPVFLERTIEKLPQEGLGDFGLEIEIEGNVVVFGKGGS